MSQGDDIQVVVFRVGAQEFALHIYHVRRIAAWEPPEPVPDAPPYHLGVLPGAAGPMPVVDLRRRFSVPDAPVGADTRIVVLDCEGATVGVVVDHVSEVLRVGAARIVPPPPAVRGIDARYVQGVIALPGRTVILLQPSRLLAASEPIALETLDGERRHG